MTKILVIGLGEIGTATATYIKQMNLISGRDQVYGYDVSPKAMEKALADYNISWTKTFAGFDVYIVCISTHEPKDMNKPYMKGIYDVCNKIANEAKPGALVCIESTVSMGTLRYFSALCHGTGIHMVHCPHRYYGKEPHEHGVKQDRVIGAPQVCCMVKGTEFYRDRLRIPVHPVSSPEIAELCKIVENGYRFLQIAFAEELRMFCESKDLDFEELRRAVNTKWNTEILEARDGIGGHCLPKDTKMLFEIDQSNMGIVRNALAVNELYKIWLQQQQQHNKKNEKEEENEVEAK